MGIGDNIRVFRDMHDLTQAELADLLDVTRESVGKWERGEMAIRDRHVSRLVELYGIEPDDILSESYGLAAKARRGALAVSMPRRSASSAPIVGDVAAGDTSEAFQIVSDELTLPDGIAERHPHACFLRVSGESMNKLFQHGEFVLYDPDEEVRDGDVAVVYVNGDEATVKRVYFAGDMVVLHPESTVDEFRDRAIDIRDPAAPPVTFAGKVVWKTLGDTEVKF